MKYFFSIFMLAAMLAVSAAENIPMEEFVARARRTNNVATYAKLHGVLQHRRRGVDPLTMPIYFGTIIHPDRTVGQLVLNNSEGYILTQAQGSGLTTVKPMGDSV